MISAPARRLEAAGKSEFATIRLRLLKIVGRIIETASRIRVSLRLMLPRSRAYQPRRVANCRNPDPDLRGAKPLEPGSPTSSAFTAFLLKSAREVWPSREPQGVGVVQLPPLCDRALGRIRWDR